MSDKKIIEIGDLSGVGPVAEEKLRTAGYMSLMSVAVASIPELAEVSGLTEKVCRKIAKEARDAINLGFEDADDFEEKRSKISRISTGLDEFDEMLGGGFECGSITEFYGEWSGGKSQLCFLACASVQKNDPNAKVIYLDTEGSFRGSRIRDFAEGFEIDPDKVLKNVKIARIYSVDHQMLMIDEIEKMINDGENIRLIIVDSLTALFRVEYQARGTLANRQQKLNKHLHNLIKVADMYGITVIVTNQVMAKPDSFYGDPTTAVGGHIVGHASSTRIYLRKGAKGSRVAKLVDSPNLPDGEVNYVITKNKLVFFKK